MAASTTAGVVAAILLITSPTAPRVALVGLRTVGPTTSGDEPAAARAFDRGEAAYADEDFAGAVTAFEEAQSLAPHPSTEYNLALALARDGQPLEAWRIFDRLQSEAGDGRLRADARQQLAELRSAVAVIVVDTGDGRAACVDGTRQDEDVERVTLPGHHRVTMGSFDQQYHVDPGETRYVDLRFVDRARTDRAITGLLVTASVSAGVATGAGIASAVADGGPTGRGTAIGAAVAGGLALSTAVAALVLHRRRGFARQRAATRNAPAPNCPPPGDDVIVRTGR